MAQFFVKATIMLLVIIDILVSNPPKTKYWINRNKILKEMESSKLIGSYFHLLLVALEKFLKSGMDQILFLAVFVGALPKQIH